MLDVANVRAIGGVRNTWLDGRSGVLGRACAPAGGGVWRGVAQVKAGVVGENKTLAYALQRSSLEDWVQKTLRGCLGLWHL